MRRGWLMLFCGIFVLLSCIFLVEAVMKQGVDSNGPNGMDKIVADIAGNGTDESVNPFTLADFNRLAEVLETKEITYIARPVKRNLQVAAGNSAYMAEVIGVGPMFESFRPISLLHGSFLTQESEAEGSQAAVVDEEFAWRAFKSEDAVGRTVKINGMEFKIVGVLRKDRSLAGRMADDGLPQIMLPGRLLPELDSASKICSVEVKARFENTMDKNRAWLSEALGQIGRNPSGFVLRDLTIEAALMGQKPRLLLFISGGIAAFMLFSYIAGGIREVVMILRREAASDYYSSVIRREKVLIGKCLLRTAAASAGIVLIWECVRFRLYIPPALIPGELIDISYYAQLIKTAFQSSMSSVYSLAGGSVGPYMKMAQILTGTVYPFLAAGSLLLIFAGLTRIGGYRTDSHKAALICGIFVTASCLTLLLVSRAAGLPLSFETRSLAAVWVSLFVQTLHFSRKGQLTAGEISGK